LCRHIYIYIYTTYTTTRWEANNRAWNDRNHRRLVVWESTLLALWRQEVSNNPFSTDES
jgi:hypothetical protein